ncbi:MAG TPA: RsmB/NOP family class I SAM-dependent RNA methyltransferase [Candidatus Saccharimonadales bacterium]
MSKTPQEKRIIKRQQLIERTSVALGISNDEAAALLRTERHQSVRINTLSPPAEMPGWLGKNLVWSTEGYELKLPVADIRDSEPVMSGQVFIQNAASWLPIIALDPRPEEVILDVCAAPGGKTSHVAARTNNRAVIWANDNSRARLAKLQANMARLTAKVTNYTLFDATQLARKLDGQQFDKILLDAPCSGEGMMNLKNDKDFNTWSVAHIKRLQQLQKRILSQAWQLLRPGGTLVYSTCTIAPEENEAVIDYLLRSREDVRIQPFDLDLPNRVPPVQEWNGRKFSAETQKCMRLKPSQTIEAFFVCKLKKNGTL